MDSTLRILTAEQVSGLIDQDELSEVLAKAMIALHQGGADVPPRVAANASGGKLLAMPGYVAGVGLAAKLVSLYPNNTERPSHQGVIIHFDHVTGQPLCVMDAEVITVERTAATAALAADSLARQDAQILTIVGAGAQAVGHARSFARLRPWSEVRVYNRTQTSAVVVAGAAKEAGVEVVEVIDTLPAAIQGADVVALCTHASEAVFDAGLIEPGVHVSSVGSAAELPPALADPDRGALVCVEWLGAVAEDPPAGAAELQHLQVDQVVTLGRILSESNIERPSPDSITVYKSTGHAAQDVAAAELVYRRAIESDVGAEVKF